MDQLSAFYKQSNHRLVRNALWIVKTEGGHTWDTWGSMTESTTPAGFAGKTPMKQLQALGFSEEAAMRMAEKEHAQLVRLLRRTRLALGPKAYRGKEEDPSRDC